MPNPLSKFFFGLAAVFFIIWMAMPLLFKETTDDDFYNYQESKGPWAVDGIRPGMTYDECARVLGPGETATGNYYGKTARKWPGRDVLVTFDDTAAGGGARDILGKTLTDLDGKVVVNGSEGENGIKKILKSAKIEKHYRPGGSGVISCSSQCDSVTFICRDARGSYSVYFYEGSFRYVRGWK